MALEPVPGFILSRERVDAERGIDLVFWLATPAGPRRWVIQGQMAVCFIATADLPAARPVLSRYPPVRQAQPKLRTFTGHPVTALYFRQQATLLDARTALTARGITVHEADINPADRYLMERFLTGSVAVLPPDSDPPDWRDARAQPMAYRPRLSCASIDIETDIHGSQLYSIAVYSEADAVVFMVGAALNPTPADLRLVMLPDASAVLQAFVTWVVDHDPDVLIGWNVVNFDLRFLQQCADAGGVALTLGRRGEAVRWRQARDAENRWFITVPGRLVLDGIELMRSATYSFESFALETVARKLLGRGKPVDDVDQRHAEITRLFLEDPARLARYNLEDCRLVWDIFVQENLVGFAIERSLLTGLEPQRYGGSVAAFDFLYLPRLHRAGYVAPALQDSPQGIHSPGGHVMDSEPGIYDDVLVLDFKSLYPSIIRTFHVDPLALVRGRDEADAIPGFEGARFSRHHHLLPQVIERLWQARDQAKADGNRVLSQAIKIIMNSFYGVLGTSGCRFHDSRLVSSITRRGHQIIQESRDFIQAQGWQVIYGDTDSLFVHVGGRENRHPQDIGAELAVALNRWWAERLRREYALDSCLEIQFETHFRRFLMPRIRGAETGSKKRYAGLVGERGKHRLVFKGLETVRSDWSPLARRFQQQLYERIFLGEPYVDYIKQTVADTLAGRVDEELLLRRRLRRRLADYVRNVPPHVQAARKAETIRADRDLPPLFDHGGWVEYVMTVAGPEPRLYQQAPLDYEFYLERQLEPVADAILVFLGTSMKELLSRQIDLFPA